MSTTTKIALKGDTARQAVDSLQGYAYQALAATLAWFDIENDGRLYLEVAQDYAVVAGKAFHAFEVKHSGRGTKKSKSVTLNSPSTRSAIAAFVDLVERNPGVQINFYFFTTLRVGTERALVDRPEGQAGLRYWEQVATGADVSPLRTILQSDRFPDSVRQFSKDRDDAKLCSDLIERIHWSCGQQDPSELRQKLEERLIAESSSRFRFPPSEAEKLADILIYKVLEKSIIKPSQDRFLTRSDLDRVIEAATRVSVPHAYIDDLLRFSSDLMRKLATREDAETGWFIDGSELPVLRATIPRAELEIKMAETLESRGVCVLVGGGGFGKFTVSRVVAAARSDTFSIAFFQNIDMAEIRVRLNRVFSRVKESAMSVLILKNLNCLDETSIAPSLARTIEVLRRHGCETLVTCHRKPSVDGLAAIGLDHNCIVDCLPFSEEEVQKLVSDYKGDPQIWGPIAYATGGFGHPQLTHAFVIGMAARGWPTGEIAEIFGRGFLSDEVNATRVAARQNLQSTHSEETRSLLYRLSLVIGDFGRPLALAVGNTPSPVDQAGECFDELIGEWIEPVNHGRFRVSPLARDFGNEMLPPDEQKQLHGVIANQMFNGSVIGTSDINAIVVHALMGKSPGILIALSESVLSANADIHETLATRLLPFRFFRVDVPIYPEDPLASAMLRLVQFKLTAIAHEEDMASEIATVLFAEVDNIPESEARHIFEAAVFINVLCTMGVANYLNNWVKLLARFKNMVEANSFLQEIVSNVEKDSSISSHFYGTLFGVGSVDLTSVNKLERVINELDDLNPSERTIWLTPPDEISSDYSVLINSPWVAAQQCPETFDAADAITRYQRMAEKTRNWDIRALFLQCSVAQAVILDEFRDDKRGAIAILNEAIDVHGSDPILNRALAKVYYRLGEYETVIEIFHSHADEIGGENPVERAYALRVAAISAAKSAKWSQAEKWFLDAQDAARQTQSGDMPVIAIGLGADAAVVALMGGNTNRALTYLAEAIEALANIDPDTTPQAAHCHRVIRQTVLLALHYVTGDDIKINGQPVAMEAGHCSNPEPPPATRERLLGHIDITWYMLAEAEIAAGIDVGITSTLIDRLQEGLIPGMEIDLRTREIERDINDLNAVGFVTHFIGYTEAAVFLSENIEQLSEICDPFSPKRGQVPALGMDVPFDSVAEQKGEDAILTYGICSTLIGRPDAIAELEAAMNSQFGGVFPGKSIFGAWRNEPTSPKNLAQTVMVSIKILSRGREMKPHDFCAIGLRFFEWGYQSNFGRLLISQLANWQRAYWKKTLSKGQFYLISPRMTVPRIETVLAMPADNRQFLAALFLVASDAVGLTLSPQYRDMLKTFAEEEEVSSSINIID